MKSALALSWSARVILTPPPLSVEHHQHPGITTIPPAGPWVPVIGNHDLPGAAWNFSGANVAWLNNYDQGAVNPGHPAARKPPFPSTARPRILWRSTYIAMKPALPPGTDADITDYLYNWLVADLQANTQPYVFVIGHEPAYVSRTPITGACVTTSPRSTSTPPTATLLEPAAS